MTHKEYESKSQMKRVEILKAEEKQMSHEELLAKLWEKRNAGCDNFDVHFALDAVVELHKPNEDNLCEICRWYMNKHKYPCPTIQAIQEQLK